MGWMRTLLLGDIGNRLDIADTERNIEQLRRDQQMSSRILNTKERTISSLLNDLAKQKLAIQALTRFLVEKDLISEDEFDDFIAEVDAEDGVLDGKMSIEPSTRRLVFPEKKIPDGTFKKVKPDSSGS